MFRSKKSSRCRETVFNYYAVGDNYLFDFFITIVDTLIESF